MPDRLLREQTDSPTDCTARSLPRGEDTGKKRLNPHLHLRSKPPVEFPQNRRETFGGLSASGCQKSVKKWSNERNYSQETGLVGDRLSLMG